MNQKNKAEISRRSFLQVTAGAIMLSGISLPESANAAKSEGLATIIDLSLCDGCVNRKIPVCVSICKEINKNKIPLPVEPIPEPWPRKMIEDWSKKQEVFDRLTPYNFIYVHRAEVNFAGRKKTIYVPRRCMHCENPPCATICPFSANHKFKNGAVVINQNQCFGGAKCRDVCPWEIPQRQSGVGIYLHVLPGFMGNGVMYKCDLCLDRINQGQLPGCIEACPREALLIGAKKVIQAVALERVRRMKGYIYGMEQNGGTSTLYISPVPFEEINKTMTKKSGQPDMKMDVPRRMAGTDPLGKMVLTAPVLGLAAAGAAGAWNWFSRRKEKMNKKEGENG